jgi:hypothetical protein
MSRTRNTSELRGEWRRPVNTSADEKGGIHDDDTAQKLGFSGGTVAGSIHMEQFSPLLLDYFGDAWWQTGSLSLYFLTATFHEQPVRCHLLPDTPVHAKVWMENESGDVVMSGTAALGEDPNSEIQQRIACAQPATDMRMLSKVKVGERSSLRPARASSEEIDTRLAVITEPLPCYEDASIFGARVLPMAPLIHTFRVVEQDIAPISGPIVGLFGAIEIRYLKGPVCAERDYLADGKVLALSESPKTEIIWYTASLRDPESSDEIARMIKMDRLMKAASPLWRSTDAQ